MLFRPLISGNLLKQSFVCCATHLWSYKYFKCASERCYLIIECCQIVVHCIKCFRLFSWRCATLLEVNDCNEIGKDQHTSLKAVKRQHEFNFLNHIKLEYSDRKTTLVNLFKTSWVSYLKCSRVTILLSLNWNLNA